MKFIKRKMRLAFYLFVKSCQLSLNIIIYFQAYLNLLVIAICVPLWYLKENLQKKKTTKKRIRGKSNNWNSITPKANVMFHLTALGWFEGHLRFCQRNNMLLDCFVAFTATDLSTSFGWHFVLLYIMFLLLELKSRLFSLNNVFQR